MEMYDLVPVNGRKSFYGNAKVVVDVNGEETLFSYGNPIVKRKGHKVMRLIDIDGVNIPDISNTTCSHIISFCGLHKRAFLKLPYRKYDDCPVHRG